MNNKAVWYAMALAIANPALAADVGRWYVAPQVGGICSRGWQPIR